MNGEGWVSLFSGGKDSAWALYRALEVGLDVRRLLTVHPTEDSYLYHVPATHLAPLAAASIGIPLHQVDETNGAGHDATERGDKEAEALELAFADIDAIVDGGIDGVILGAIESEYQFSRIRSLCDRLDLELFAPLWHAEPTALGNRMLEAGFEIRILQVAADGLDESWLGRRLDRRAFEDLQRIHEEYGVHVMGEGGEFETLVVDGPHMDRRIDVEFETVWDGTRGHLDIQRARLE